MSSAIEHFGVVYDEKTDWRAFLKDALSGSVYEGLDIDRHFGQSLPDALGELAEALRGTPMEIGLADAALEIIEGGNEEEMEIVRSAGWAKAPNAFERILSLVLSPRRRLSNVWLGRAVRSAASHQVYRFASARKAAAYDGHAALGRACGQGRQERR